MDNKKDERAKAAEQRKRAAAEQRDVTPPTNPDDGLTHRA